ncbi:MAG TPA: acyltransferase domain-containing protein, partial [Streptomyces sp.]|nr:acyltransferase domain-containing protein [Streptomyces sp.]
GIKPPTLHISQPNKAWEKEGSPFQFHAAARPWAAEPDQRVAGVSAFGFGGTNFHAVLRAYDQAPSVHARDEWPVELFTFRGKDAASAQRAVRRLLEQVEASAQRGTWRLRDYARGAARISDSAAVRGEPVRIALLAQSVGELPALLSRAADGVHAPAEGIFAAATLSGGPDGSGSGRPGGGPADGSLAFLFPGQGSQRPGMLADIFVAFPELQRYLQLGSRWADALYPPTAFDKATADEQLARITDTAVAQPTLGIVELAAADLLASLGIRPDMAAGHSYGELVALGVAGAMAPQDVLNASAARAEAILGQIQDGDAGTMAAVTALPEKVDEVLALAGLDGEVVTANRNSPQQTVISGPSDAVTKAVGHLRDAGLSAKPLQVACAFHSPLVAGAGETFAGTLREMNVQAPGIPVWANSTAEPYDTDPHAVRAGLAEQIASPVRFADQIEAMYAAGARVFTEVGPGKVLTRLVSAVLGDRPHTTVTLEDARRGGLYGLLSGVAQLAVAGTDVRTGKLFQGRDAVDPETATPVSPAGWTVDGQLIRLADGTIPPNALQPARPVTELIVPESPHQDGVAPSGPDALIAEFLRTSREMVTAQRDVLLRYLGATELPPAASENSAMPAPAMLPQAVAPAHVAQPAPAVAAPQVSVAVVPALDADAVLGSVLAVVAERTGYPVDMIEPGLDLEADLSVDSIKRAEIAGELAVRLGLPVDQDADLDELSTARTAAGITELLMARLGGGTPETATASAAPVDVPGRPEQMVPAGEAEAVVVPPQRLEFTETELPAPAEALAPGTTVTLLGGGALAEVLAEQLRVAGADPHTVPDGHLPERIGEAVLYLHAFETPDSQLPDAFPLFQAVLAAGPKRLLAVE